MKRLVFLDFDGVLHPNFSTAEEHFVKAERLLAALDGFESEVAIVVSSSWRFQYEWRELLGVMPKAIGALAAGATPEVEPVRHQRYREIRAYLARRPMADWRAIDDDLLGFPGDCSNLIACDGRVGFDDDAAALLRAWLER